MEKRHRVFMAINLPNEIKNELFLYSEKWSRQSRGSSITEPSGPELPAKWTAKDNLHITLEFLGDLTDVEIADACKIVKEVAKNHNSFSVNLNKILYGPPKKNPPRMVWAEGKNSEELAELKNDMQEYLLEKISYKPDPVRAFHPHITLARIQEWEFRKFELDERPDINEDIDLVFTVESIEVMESELKRTGPVYTVLESHILGE